VHEAMNPAYGVSLEPVFTAKTFNYHAFGHEFSAVKIITGEPNETVTINGTAITSGVFSDPIPLKLGDNIITIKVTAQDGITTQTYTITVTRQLTAPRIAYNAKNTYVTGTAIVPLIPTNAGDSVAAPAFGKPVFYLGAVKPVSLTRSLIKSGVRPMFFGDAGNGTVYQLMGSVAVSSDFNAPYGLATDTEGALYVADAGKSSITKFSVTGFNFSYVYGPPVALGSGFNAPTGIAVDPSSGFIYVADNGNGLLKKMSPDGTTITTIGTGLVKPAGVALDAYGNLYVTDNGDNTVKKIAAGSNTATVFASGFRNPFGISIDGGGNIYVADKGLGTIVRVSASGSSKVTICSGFSGPTSVFAENIGFDAGVLYVTDTNRGRIDKITPVGGYYILPALPAGLHFNAVTGVISGTPTAVSSLTNYVVYAYNGSGVSWTTFRIVVNAPPGGLATQETSDGILVHQALSPNGDGLNDVLKIDGLNAFPDNKLTIMNKDGAVIFAAKNYGSNLAAFDGHSNKGKLQKPGDYFYLLEYKAGTQVKRKTGYILLKY